MEGQTTIIVFLFYIALLQTLQTDFRTLNIAADVLFTGIGNDVINSAVVGWTKMWLSFFWRHPWAIGASLASIVVGTAAIWYARLPYRHGDCIRTRNYVLYIHRDPRPVAEIRTCSICLEELPRKINVTDKIICTECHHLFCKTCLEEWIHRRLSCPVCRQSIIKANSR
mgnify:CR=1 FL=1